MMKKLFLNSIYVSLLNLFLITFSIAQEPVSNAKPRYSENSIQNVLIPKSRKDRKKKAKVSENSSSKTINQKFYPALIYNSENKIVRNLKESDVKIFADGNEQKITSIKSFQNGMNIVLMMDVSNSSTYSIEKIKNVFAVFVEKIRPQDKLFLVTFSDKIKLIGNAQTERKKILEEIKDIDTNAGTSIHDAIDKTISEFVTASGEPTAVVLLTDGVDTASSKNSFDKVLSKVEESGAVFSVIYNNTLKEVEEKSKPKTRKINPALASIINNRQFNNDVIGASKDEYELGKHFLNSLVVLSGGRAVNTNSSEKEFIQAFDLIYEEFKNQILVGFESENEKPNEVRVRINQPDLYIRTKNKLVFEERK